MIELSCNCDGCRKGLSNGDEIYCGGCVTELRQEIEKLEKQMEKEPLRIQAHKEAADESHEV